LLERLGAAFAFFVAASMAVIRAPYSPASDSMSAR
jgi:hypothetical protein